MAAWQVQQGGAGEAGGHMHTEACFPAGQLSLGGTLGFKVAQQTVVSTLTMAGRGSVIILFYLLFLEVAFLKKLLMSK